MEKFSIDTGRTPQVFIQSIGGDLYLKGQDLEEIILKTPGTAAPQFEKDEERVVINCQNDCTVYVPHGAAVHIQSVSGDASIKSLQGELNIDNVGRDLSLLDVGKVTAANIGTDLTAKRVHGDINITSIGRGAIVRDIDGQFAAQSVGAQLHLRDVSGGVAAKVGGNAVLSLAPIPWQAYDVNCGGNIKCRLMDEVNADLQIKSGSQQIRIAVPGKAETIKQGNYEFSLGEGGTSLKLSAGGKVDISSRKSGWEGLGTYDSEFEMDPEQMDLLSEEIELQVTTQIEAMTEQLDVYLEDLSDSINTMELSEKETERINRKIEKARVKAESKAQRATQKAQRKMEAARRKAERKAGKTSSRSKSFVWPMPSTQGVSQEETEPVSEEERLMILKMLEDNQISLEEAEQLLSALEGQDE